MTQFLGDLLEQNEGARRGYLGDLPEPRPDAPKERPIWAKAYELMTGTNLDDVDVQAAAEKRGNLKQKMINSAVRGYDALLTTAQRALMPPGTEGAPNARDALGAVVEGLTWGLAPDTTVDEAVKNIERTRGQLESYLEQNPVETVSLADVLAADDVSLGDYLTDLAASSWFDTVVSVAGAASGAGLVKEGGKKALQAAATIAGGTAATAPLFAGRNLDAQMEAQDVDLEDTDFGRAALTALAQGSLDSVLSRILLLRFGGEATEAATKATRSQLTDLLKRAATETRKAAASGAIEGVTEGTQAYLERLQADPESWNDFSPEVRQDLIENVIGGALLGGTLDVASSAAGAGAREAAKLPDVLRRTPAERVQRVMGRRPSADEETLARFASGEEVDLPDGVSAEQMVDRAVKAGMVRRASDGKLRPTDKAREMRSRLAGWDSMKTAVEVAGEDQVANNALREAITEAGAISAQRPEDRRERRRGRVKTDIGELIIDTPVGGAREGVSEDGELWRQGMTANYGHIAGSEGKRGAKIGVYIGSRPAANVAFIVNQTDADGQFDEPKVMLGYGSAREALQVYRQNYAPARDQQVEITPIHRADLTEWVKSPQPRPYRTQDTMAAAPDGETGGVVAALAETDVQDAVVQQVDNGPGADLPTNPEVRAKWGAWSERHPETMQLLGRYLTDEEKSMLSNATVANIDDLLRPGNMASSDEIASMSQRGQAKRGWYAGSKAALDAFFGGDASRFTYLLAALSPQTSVEANTRNALRVWFAWNKAGRPTDTKSVNRILDESVERSEGSDESGMLEAWRKNSVAALTGSDQVIQPGRLVLSGPKVNSFYRNLRGDMNEVTVDTWQLKAMGRREKELGRGATQEIERRTGIPKDTGTKDAAYLAVNAITRQAANILNARRAPSEAEWTPAEVQETVWSYIKALWETRDKNARRTMEEIDQVLTDDVINSVPDFAGLFLGDQVVRSIIEESGYGDRLKRLEGLESQQIGRGKAAGDLDPDARGSLLRRLAGIDRQYAAARLPGLSRRIQADLGFQPDGSRAGGRARPFPRADRRPLGRYLEGLEGWEYTSRYADDWAGLGIGTKVGAAGQAGPPPSIFELKKGSKAAARFSKAIKAAKAADPVNSPAVFVYPQAEYRKMRLFLSEDGQTGFALKDDDIVSVFNLRGGDYRGMAPYLINLAVQEGGRRLDAFDTVLPYIYSQAGFVSVARLKWNDEYAPPGWDKSAQAAYNGGEPDVVFMAFAPYLAGDKRKPEPVAPRKYSSGGRRKELLTDDYDDALGRQRIVSAGGLPALKRESQAIKERRKKAREEAAQRRKQKREAQRDDDTAPAAALSGADYNALMRLSEAVGEDIQALLSPQRVERTQDSVMFVADLAEASPEMMAAFPLDPVSAVREYVSLHPNWRRGWRSDLTAVTAAVKLHAPELVPHVEKLARAFRAADQGQDLDEDGWRSVAQAVGPSVTPDMPLESGQILSKLDDRQIRALSRALDSFMPEDLASLTPEAKQVVTDIGNASTPEPAPAEAVQQAEEFFNRYGNESQQRRARRAPRLPAVPAEERLTIRNGTPKTKALRQLIETDSRITGYSIEPDRVFIYTDGEAWVADDGSGTFAGDSETAAVRDFKARVMPGDQVARSIAGRQGGMGQRIASKVRRKRQVTAVARDWAKRHGQFAGLTIRVVGGFEDLPPRQQAAGARAQAMFDPARREVVIRADMAKSPRHVEELLFHETVGHYGLRAVLGANYSAYMQRFRESFPDAVRERSEFGYGPVNADIVAEEAIALMAERLLAGTPMPSEMQLFFDRLIAAIKQFMASVTGRTPAMTKGDVMRLLRRARQYTMDPRARSIRAHQSPPPVASRAWMALSQSDKPSAQMAEDWEQEVRNQLRSGAFTAAEAAVTREWLKGRRGTRVSQNEVLDFLERLDPTVVPNAPPVSYAKATPSFGRSARVQQALETISAARKAAQKTGAQRSVLFHSSSQISPEALQEGLGPEVGAWVREVLGGDEAASEAAERAVPVVFTSDRPSWVRMQVARKLGKPLSSVTDQDVRQHGTLAIVTNVDADGGPEADVYQVISTDAEYAQVRDVFGKEQSLLETDLYEFDDLSSTPRTPLGLEPGDIVSAEPLIPAMVLTGDDLVELLAAYESDVPAASMDDHMESLWENEAFRSWFRDSVVTTDEEPGSPPIPVYHGTTRAFTKFDVSRGSLEGGFGRAIYLTTNPKDASENYARAEENPLLLGPDARVGMLSFIQQNIDGRSAEGVMKAWKQLSESQQFGVLRDFNEMNGGLWELTEDQMEGLIAEDVEMKNLLRELIQSERYITYNGGGNGDLLASLILRQHLYPDPQVMPLVVRAERPFRAKRTTSLGDNEVQALIDASENVFGEEVDLSELWEERRDGVSMYLAIVRIMAEQLDYTSGFSDKDSGLIFDREAAAEILREAGYDSIIADPAAFWVGMYGGEEGRQDHVMVWSPNQVKSIFNQGTWSDDDFDIARSMSRQQAGNAEGGIVDDKRFLDEDLAEWEPEDFVTDRMRAELETVEQFLPAVEDMGAGALIVAAERNDDLEDVAEAAVAGEGDFSATSAQTALKLMAKHGTGKAYQRLAKALRDAGYPGDIPERTAGKGRLISRFMEQSRVGVELGARLGEDAMEAINKIRQVRDFQQGLFEAAGSMDGYLAAWYATSMSGRELSEEHSVQELASGYAAAREAGYQRQVRALHDALQLVSPQEGPVAALSSIDEAKARVDAILTDTDGEQAQWDLPIEGPGARAWNWTVYRMQNRMIDLLRAQRAIERTHDIALPEELDAYMAESQFSGRARAMVDAYEDRFIRPLITEMVEQGVDWADLELYLYARHAPEANRHLAKINRSPEIEKRRQRQVRAAAAKFARQRRRVPEKRKERERQERLKHERNLRMIDREEELRLRFGLKRAELLQRERVRTQAQIEGIRRRYERLRAQAAARLTAQQAAAEVKRERELLSAQIARIESEAKIRARGKTPEQRRKLAEGRDSKIQRAQERTQRRIAAIQEGRIQEEWELFQEREQMEGMALVQRLRQAEAREQQVELSPKERAAIEERAAGQRQRENARHGEALQRLDEQAAEAVQLAEKRMLSAITEINQEAQFEQQRRLVERDLLSLSGMSDARAAEVMEEFEEQGLLPKLRSLAERVDAMTRENVRIMRDEKLVDVEIIDAWEATYQYYVPLKGYKDGPAGTLMPTGSGYQVKHNAVKRRLGRRSEATNILANIAAQAQATVVQAEKQRVARAVLRLAEEYPNPDFWSIDEEQYERDIDKTTGMVTYRRKRPAETDLRVIDEGGVARVIQFNEQNEAAMRLAAALKNLSNQDIGPITRAVGNLSRYLAAINTSYNPQFMITNFLRDLQTAAINLSATEAHELRMRILGDVAAAANGVRLWQAHRVRGQERNSEWERAFDQFRKNGGQTGWMDNYEDITQLEEELRRQYQMQQNPTAPLSMGRAFLRMVRHGNDVIENAIRLSTFKNAVDAGISPAKAAMLAKDLTVNFNRRGQSAAMTGSWYLFFNAAVQGSAIVIRTLKSPRAWVAVAGMTVGAATLGVLQRIIGGDDEDGVNRYDRVPDYVKERNLVLMLPSSMQPSNEDDLRDFYVKVPLPYGWNTFMVAGDAFGSAISHGLGLKDEFDPLTEAARVVSAGVNSFNPIGSGANLLETIAPTVVDPMVQIYTNTNFFGGELMPAQDPYALADAPESERFYRSTPDAFVEVARYMNEFPRQMDPLLPEWMDPILDIGGTRAKASRIPMADQSPETLELWTSFFAGGLGRLAAQTWTLGGKIWGNEDIEPSEVPFYGQLVGATDEGTLSQEFYDIASRLEEAEKQIEVAAEMYREAPAERRERYREELDEIRDRYQVELGLVGRMEAFGEALSKLRRRMDAIEKSDRPRKERDAEIESLERRRADIMDRMIKMYQERKFPNSEAVSMIEDQVSGQGPQSASQVAASLGYTQTAALFAALPESFTSG